MLLERKFSKLNSTEKHIVILTSGGRVVTKNSPTGGIFFLNQAKLISKYFKKVSLLSSGFIEFREILKKDTYPSIEKFNNLEIRRNYKKHYFPRRYLSYSFQKKIYIKMAIKQFKEYINEHGIPDIIHAHNVVFSGVVGQRIYEDYNVPYLITDHSTAYYMNVYSKSFLNKLKADVDNCILSTVTRSNSILLKKIFKRDVSVLPNMHEDCFEYKAITKKESPFEFICVANLIPIKNLSKVLTSFEKISCSHDALLTIVGNGPLKKNLVSQISKLNIEERVKIIEYLTPKELASKFNHSNCLILVSRYETFGVVVIEAMSSGLPVIISDKVAIGEIVNPSNGCIVQVSNIPQLVSAMKNIIENYNNYDRKKISEESINRFGKKAFMENLLKLYKLKW